MSRSEDQAERAGLDDALMARFAAGNATAFDELYEHYEAPIYGFCLRLLSDEDAAADVFQEVFIRVIDARSAYEPRARFRSWVFTIARRLCVDRLRERTHEPLGNDLRADDRVSFHRDIENRDEIARVLSRVSPDHREVLLLHRYYGFSYGEIAAMVGTTEAAVKQKAYRAVLGIRNGGRLTS